MRGDPADRERLGWITSWPLVLLILVLAFLALGDVNPDGPATGIYSGRINPAMKNPPPLKISK